MLLESLVVSLCPWCPLLHVLSVFLELLQYPNHPPPRRTVLFPHESCLYCMYNTTYKPFRPHHANPHAYIPSRSDCPRAGNALGHICAGAIGNCRKEDASHRLLGPFHLKPAISKALSSLAQRSTAAVCRNLAGQVDRFMQLCFHLAHLGIDFVL